MEVQEAFNNDLGNSYVANLQEILAKGYTSKPRGMEIKELLGCYIKGQANKSQIIAFPEIRDVSNPEKSEGLYLMAELLWYFSGSNRSQIIGIFGDTWNKITSKDGTLNSNYGRSILYDSVPGAKHNKFDWMIRTLAKDKDSRQAIIPYVNDCIYSPGFGNDFTCTQLQHFFIRNDTLHSIVYIRSSDSVFGLNYDIPFWSLIYQMAKKYLENNILEIENYSKPSAPYKDGDLTIFIGSSHIYSRHYELCKNIYSQFNLDAKNTFKSISFKDVAFEVYKYLESDKKLDKELIFDLSSESMRLLGLTESETKKKLFTNIIFADDPETSYYDRPDKVCRYAKAMMRIFRNTYYLNKELQQLAINDFKRIWSKYIKLWFDTFFKIS